MDWTVHLFGPLAQAAQRTQITVRLEDASPTVANLRSPLAEVAPELAPLLPTCRFAVNHGFAAENQPLRPGDEIALIGMVSGG